MIFSIIIPAYNVADYIKKAVESCINQVNIAVDDYEIIVIDDGSNDQTGKIIDEYVNLPNIRIIHQSNRGLSCTRNRGMELAKGDFIIYLDGDDWLRYDALQLLKQYTYDSDLIVFPMNYWYSSDKYEVKSYGLSDRMLTANEFLSETIGKQKLNIIPAQCKCYRSNILKTHSQQFIEGILHEDNPYFIDTVLNFRRIKYIDDGVYFYRQNRAGSITSSQTLKNFDGTIIGIKHAISRFGFKNRNINYLMTCWHTFQVLLNYNDEADKKNVVIKYYRQPRIKWQIIRMLINSTYVPKQIVRTILLLIDPMVLTKFGDILYGKRR